MIIYRITMKNPQLSDHASSLTLVELHMLDITVYVALAIYKQHQNGSKQMIGSYYWKN